MLRKEFLRAMEENLMILDRMMGRLKTSPVKETGYPRQLLTILLRLQKQGRARLKDIARREGLSTPNLCAAFRRLERDGLVVRVTDDEDRRNVWYDVTDAGNEVALRALDSIRRAINELFVNMAPAEETKVIESLQTINNVLKNLEIK